MYEVMLPLTINTPDFVQSNYLLEYQQNRKAHKTVIKTLLYLLKSFIFPNLTCQLFKC